MAFKKKFYKETEDDWYPSYEIEYQGILRLVMVSYSQRPDGKFRISVWGTDDFSLSFEPKTIEEAEEIIQKIIDIDFVNQGWLVSLGFGTD